SPRTFFFYWQSVVLFRRRFSDNSSTIFKFIRD
ncbi:AAA domain family protein, partial [Chlamydia psittaci 06-1683]